MSWNIEYQQQNKQQREQLWVLALIVLDGTLKPLVPHLDNKYGITLTVTYCFTLICHWDSPAACTHSTEHGWTSNLSQISACIKKRYPLTTDMHACTVCLCSLRGKEPTGLDPPWSGSAQQALFCRQLPSNTIMSSFHGENQWFHYQLHYLMPCYPIHCLNGTREMLDIFQRHLKLV